jgi:hypothetical protein
MRTTIRLDDPLLRQAKSRAAELGTSLNDFIEQAVRVALAPPRAAATRPTIPVDRGGHLLPGVNLDDSTALLDLIEDPVRYQTRNVTRRVAEGPTAE